MVNFQEQGQLEELAGWDGGRQSTGRGWLWLVRQVERRMVKVREVERRLVKVTVSWWSDSCERWALYPRQGQARSGRKGQGSRVQAGLVSSVSVTTMPGICYTGIVIVTVQLSRYHTTTSTTSNTSSLHTLRQSILGDHGGGDEAGGGVGEGWGLEPWVFAWYLDSGVSWAVTAVWVLPASVLFWATRE